MAWFRFAHRARAALLALSRSSSDVSLAARAGPPFLPPRRPRATAAGFFRAIALSMPKRSGIVKKYRLTYARAVTHNGDMNNKEPRAASNDSGWRHTPTAEAAGMRLVAASSLRPSAQKRKAAMNVLKPEKQLVVLSALVEGVSIRSIERMTGIHRDTIMRLLVRVGGHCSELLDERMRGLRCQRVQVDEIWTYVGRKQARLAYEERFDPEVGDQYVFVAMDAETKLVPWFEVGKRNATVATRFMGALKTRLTGHFQLTTDGFTPYIGAVDSAWGAESPDFGMLVKAFRGTAGGPRGYLPAKFLDAVKTIVWGQPDPAHISTSYIERQNLTIRMACRRFTRLTNAFSKKLDNLKAALALHFCWYNFVRIHRSLKVTPAMAAGVTDRVWGLEEIIA